jgi:cob(I)alamin adenosyltransferase
MKGLVHIYCGEGKGKTTAAVGLAVRAAGNGLKVLIVQFLKNGKTGELASFEKLENITVIRGKGSSKFVWNMNEEEKEAALLMHTQNLQMVMEASSNYDLMILDEAIGACSCGLLEKELLCSFLDKRPEGLEVVLTGRYPAQELLDRADYISEIKKIRHPYDKGVMARKGIER